MDLDHVVQGILVAVAQFTVLLRHGAVLITSHSVVEGVEALDKLDVSYAFTQMLSHLRISRHGRYETGLAAAVRYAALLAEEQ